MNVDASTTPAQLPPQVLILSPATPSDQRWASRLQRRLRRYRPPADAVVRWRECRSVVVDSAADAEVLDDRARRLVAAADFLVVVCSLRTPTSPRILALVECFLADRPPHRVLPFMVEADPFATFPGEFLRRVTRRVRGADGIDRVVVDQLAASVVLYGERRSRELFNEEFLRLAAPILGCEFDALYARERARRRRRRWRVAAVAAVAAVIAAIPAWSVSTTEAWVKTTVTRLWQQLEGGQSGASIGRFGARFSRLSSGAMLANASLGPGLAVWSAPSDRWIWTAPLLRHLGPKSSRYAIAAADDQLSIVGVDLETGASRRTPFRLSEPMTSIEAKLTGTGAELLVRPAPNEDRFVLWSFREQREIASFVGLIAPPNQPQRAMPPGALPPDLFVGNTTITSDLMRLIAPCQTGGRVATCLWDVRTRSPLAVLSADAGHEFLGFAIDESRGIVATAEYLGQHGFLAFWRLQDGVRIRQADFPRSTGPLPGWPEITRRGTHLWVSAGDATLLVDLSTLDQPTLATQTVRIGRLYTDAVPEGSTDVAAWAASPQDTAIWNLAEQGSAVIIKGLPLASTDFFMLLPDRERLIVGVPDAVEIWDTRAGARVAPPIARDRRTSTNPTLDGGGIVLSQANGSLRVVDVGTGEVAFSLPFLTSIFTQVRRDAAQQRIDLYTDTGDLVRYQWRRVNRVARWVRSFFAVSED